MVVVTEASWKRDGSELEEGRKRVGRGTEAIWKRDGRELEECQAIRREAGRNQSGRAGMEITEVRIKLMDNADDRLQAFCSVTFDHAFVVRDLKIIGGANGPFVAMPSRKLTSHCPQCGFKNHLRAHYCNQCGARQRDDRTIRDPDGRIKLYADIAHPINAQCREQIQGRVLAEFRQELERSRLPGYVSRYDEDYDLDYDLPPESPGSATLPVSATPAGAATSAEAATLVGATTGSDPASVVRSVPDAFAPQPAAVPAGMPAGDASARPTAMPGIAATANQAAPDRTVLDRASLDRASLDRTASGGDVSGPTAEDRAIKGTREQPSQRAAPPAPTQSPTQAPTQSSTQATSAPPIPPPHTPPRGNRTFGAGVFDEERKAR